MKFIGMKWPEEFVEKVDEARGDESRTQWVKGAIEERLRKGPLLSKGPYTTKSGKVLTDEDIERLADEAEQGHDVSELKRVGRLTATSVRFYGGFADVELSNGEVIKHVEASDHTGTPTPSPLTSEVGPAARERHTKGGYASGDTPASELEPPRGIQAPPHPEGCPECGAVGEQRNMGGGRYRCGQCGVIYRP